jgi:hypothetical protein
MGRGERVGQLSLFDTAEQTDAHEHVGPPGHGTTLWALQSIRARLDDGEPIYVILDNLNHHENRTVREWCDANAVELVFTPTYASWANPIEAHFGPLRQSVLANSDHPDHPALGRAILLPLAQHPRSRPRDPRSRTPPPSPHSQRTTTPLGPPPPSGRIARECSWSEH